MTTSKRLLALTAATFLSIGFIVVGCSKNDDASSLTPEQHEQLNDQQAAQKTAAHLAERAGWAARDANQTAREEARTDSLKRIEQRMTKLQTAPASTGAWKVEALAIAGGLNAQPNSDALVALKMRWRAMPAVLRAAAADLREDMLAADRELPKLLADKQRAFVEQIDRVLLDQGIEAEVSQRKGPKGATLLISYALSGRVFADRLANKAGLYGSAAQTGFIELVFVNSINGSTVTYKLPSAKRDALKYVIEHVWALVD
jgi:hypothetical protein